MEIVKQARDIIAKEIEALQVTSNAIDSNFVDAVTQLKTCIQDQHKIILSGVGKSAKIAAKIAATFNSTGASAFTLDVQDAVHGDLGMLNDGDIFIGLSFSGETEELLNLLPFIKRKKINIIAITKEKSSSLAQFADITLLTPIVEEACPHNLAPTSSAICALAIGDCLAMVLMSQRGFGQAEFAKYHPAGSLGKKLFIKIKDIMRPLIDCAIVNTTHTVAATIAMMQQKKCGIAVIIGEQQELLGVFTHGDFIRLNTTAINDIMQKKMTQVMTKNPHFIQQSSLAVEAVKLIEACCIDDIVVIDDAQRVVGVVDSQDLAKKQLI